MNAALTLQFPLAVPARHDPFEGLDIPVDPGLEAALAQHNQQLPGHGDDSDEDHDQNDSQYLAPSHSLNEGDVQVHGPGIVDGMGLPATGTQYFAPEGMRFCSGCRSNKPVEDFHDGRRMCFKHKKAKYHDNPPPPVEKLDDIGERLKASSEEKGCDGFEASLLLADIPHLPGIDDSDKVFELPPFAAAPPTNPEDMSTETVSEEVASMRRARARCRPLVEYIHQMSGYSFVYKDCRSGRRLKYQHSLRYLCAQREDQDNSKRRSSDKKKAEEDEEPEPEMTYGPTDGDIHAATSAAIAAMVQAAQGIPADLSALLAGEEDGNNDVDLDLDVNGNTNASTSAEAQALARAQAEAEATAAIVAASAAAVAASQAADALAEAAALAGHEPPQEDMQVDSLPDLPVHTEDDPSGSNAGEDDDEDGTKPQKNGRGKGWRRGTGKQTNKVKNPNKKPQKPRSVQKKMHRFDCKGSLIINIHHDATTVFFVISHQLHHEKYVDVVGNRLRGPRFGPIPINLTQTIQAPIGSVEFEGDTVFEKTEKALKSMIDLVRELKNKTGGGEEETAEEIYRRTLDARTYRVSVVEALAKGGKQKKEKGERRPRKVAAKKRKAEDMDGPVDEGALRQIEPPPTEPTPDPVAAATEAALMRLGLPEEAIQAQEGATEDIQLQPAAAEEGPTAEQMQDLVALYLDRGTSGEGAWALDPALQRAMGQLSQP